MVPTAAWKGVSSEKGASDGMDQRLKEHSPSACYSTHSSHLHSAGPRPYQAPGALWPQAEG